MDNHDRLLSAFLAGELSLEAARRWDEHLLECERCWRAVREDWAGKQAAQLMRQPVPSGLADRVAFAVEVAAAERSVEAPQAIPRASPRHGRRATRRRRRSWRLAAAGLTVASVAAGLIVALVPGAHETTDLPAAVAAVARYAQAIPAPARGPHWSPRVPAAPIEVGRPARVVVGGQRIVLRTWRLGGAEAVVAVSGRPFPRPTRARGVSGMGMAWTARVGRLDLYCLNGRTSELVAAPVPAAELAALAARLPTG